MACGLLNLAEAVKLGAESCSGSKGYVMSCGCEEEDKPEPPNPTPPIDNLPEALGDIEMNVDVLLTHILHEVHPDIPDFPDTNTPEEREIITEVIEPVVIQLINDDIVPSIPTCTLPGQQGSAYDPPLVDEWMVDTADAMKEVISQSLEQMELGGGVSYDEIIDQAMPSQDVIDSLDLETEEGEQMMLEIIEQARNIATALDEQEEPVPDVLPADDEEPMDDEEPVDDVEPVDG